MTEHMKYTEGRVKMNNNLILEAEELFKKSALTADHMLFVEAISLPRKTKISKLDSRTKSNVKVMIRIQA